MTGPEADEIIETAHAMADAARRAVLPFFRAEGLIAEDKGDKLFDSGFDPVTEKASGIDPLVLDGLSVDLAGRRDVMEKLAPLGPVYQAGTLSGNPVAVAAGLATLERLDSQLYAHLEKLGARLQAGLEKALSARQVTATVQRVGSMITVFFHPGPVRSWLDASAADRDRFAKFHAGLLSRGVYWPASQFEAAFLSAAHTDADIDRTIEAADAALGD